ETILHGFSLGRVRKPPRDGRVYVRRGGDPFGRLAARGSTVCALPRAIDRGRRLRIPRRREGSLGRGTPNERKQFVSRTCSGAAGAERDVEDLVHLRAGRPCACQQGEAEPSSPGRPGLTLDASGYEVVGAFVI